MTVLRTTSSSMSCKTKMLPWSSLRGWNAVLSSSII